MKLSDWLPSVFVEGDGDDIQVTTKKFSQFPTATGEGIQGVGIKDGNNVKFELTTDSIKVNPEPFRDKNGQFIGTPEELAGLENQRDVNNFLYGAINDIEAGDINLDGYATEEWVEDQLGELPPGTVVSDTAPEDPEEGMCWYDTVRLELFVFAEGAWLPCSPLGARVEQGEILQAEILGRVEAGEVQQQTLVEKVNALEGAVGEHSLVFTSLNSNPRSGEFNLKDGAMQLTNTIASADYITLSDTDRNGNTISLDRITEGDVLRFSSVDGQAAELKITSGSNGVYAFDKVGGDLDRLSELPYDFILLSSFDPAGLATIDYVDAQDGNKLGKSEANEVANSFRIRGTGGTYISAAGGELGLYHVKYPEAETHAATMGYVEDNFAGLGTNNTFTGVQTFSKSAYFQNAIILNGKNSDTITEVRGENDDTRQLWHKIRGTNRVSWICYPGQENVGYKRCMEMEWDADAEAPVVKLDYLQPPSQRRHAATKEYVDEEIAKAGGGAIARSGTDENPTLATGELYLCTTNNTLLIGT